MQPISSLQLLSQHLPTVCMQAFVRFTLTGSASVLMRLVPWEAGTWRDSSSAAHSCVSCCLYTGVKGPAGQGQARGIEERGSQGQRLGLKQALTKKGRKKDRKNCVDVGMT